jgi:hypothetical protein
MRMLCFGCYRHTSGQRRCQQQHACLFCHFFLHQDEFRPFNRLNGGGFGNRRFHRGFYRFALLALLDRRRSINSAVG